VSKKPMRFGSWNGGHRTLTVTCFHPSLEEGSGPSVPGAGSEAGQATSAEILA
jgi:hypothetical protein